MDPQGPSGTSFLQRYVAFLARHDLALAIGGFALFVLSILASRRLQLRADLTELLPQNDPALVELRSISDRVGAPATLVVAVEGPDRHANERFADALAGNLRPLLGKDLRAIDYRSDSAKSFFEHNKALYAPLDDLRRIDDDFRKLLQEKKNPAFVAFADPSLGEEEDDPEDDLKALKKQLDQKAKDADKFPSGYYEGEDGHLLAMITWTRSSGTGDLSGFQIRDDVQRAVDATNPRAFGDVTVHLTGDVESAIEEHESLKSDIELVSLLTTFFVLLVIVVYYRSLLSIPHIFFPALLGVAVAFGVTAFAIGYLNTNTAFLGSIILGNGINFGIILLARYHEERASGATIEPSLERALHRTAHPTLVASLAAAIAYGSLGITRFRGFQQFGFVGGIGMVLCWLFTFSYCPALVLLWERLWHGRRRVTRSAGAGALTRLARGLLSHPRLTIGLAAVVTALSVGAVMKVVVRGNVFEYDFRKLRNQESRKHGAGELYVRVGRVFPQDISPIGIALVPKPEDAPLYHDVLLERDCREAELGNHTPLSRSSAALDAECRRRVENGEPTGGILGQVRTAYGVLPRDQGAKLAVIAELRKRLSDPAMNLLTPDEHQQVDDWTPPADLHALAPGDLPESLARPYRELDGTVGRVALIFPIRGFQTWNGHNLLRLADLIHDVRLPDGRVDAGGNASVFAAMIRSIAHDGPIASLASLFGVVLLVVLFFRRAAGIALVLGSLLVGVLWMTGAGAGFGLKLNFLNFVALPVTLGIGVDYAVNVYARLAREPKRSYPRALAETGSAVALCSSTTIIGYSSLLIAANGALRSFGKLADLGEAGCLLAALLLVPAVRAIAVRWNRSDVEAAGPAGGEASGGACQ